MACSMVVAFLVALCSGLCSSASWDYATYGPSTWADNFAVCGSSKQSPINIVSAEAVEDANLTLFDRDWYYDPPTEMTLKNNGHSLQVDIVSGNTEINQPGFLPFTARLEQYHLHWGSSSSTKGSEHTLNGVQYTAEIHFVHYNTKYNNIGAAVNQSDGLAVLGFFIETGYPQDNKAFDYLLDHLEMVANKSDNVPFTGNDVFSVETLLPPKTDVYYRYKGSLTTPTCDESVVWTVFEDPIEISEDQAERLATMLYVTNTTGQVIQDNFRPVQPLNGRTVTKPVPLTQYSASGIIKPTIFMGLLSCFTALFLRFN